MLKECLRVHHSKEKTKKNMLMLNANKLLELI